MAIAIFLTVSQGIAHDQEFQAIYRLGIARSFIANFLSLPILAGFLNGIALIIVAGQLSKLFGYAGAAARVPKQDKANGHHSGNDDCSAKN